MQDKFISFWSTVDDKLGDNVNVVGFDPLNEPIASWRSFNEFISTLVPGHYDRQTLGPLYEKIFAKVRKSGIMMFEPSLFPDYLAFKIGDWQAAEKIWPVGWHKPPGGEKGSPKHALNGHSYCCMLNDDVCKSGEPSPDSGK